MISGLTAAAQISPMKVCFPGEQGDSLSDDKKKLLIHHVSSHDGTSVLRCALLGLPFSPNFLLAYGALRLKCSQGHLFEFELAKPSRL